ncbi:MAG: UDP-N-acetylmuramate dehydrogenase [Oscillospiraceae bacterium]|nr:UDP-N-acetylmuramate dehydrogenase [Candidatus Ruminococcus equi]
MLSVDKTENLINILKTLSAEYIENEPMKNHTTFKIGGNADIFVKVFDKKSLSLLVSYCIENDIDYFILGKGSNILVSDDGLSKVVITLDGEFKNIEVNGETIKCGAGVALSKLCTVALDNSLSGLEFAYGIPGSVGGATFMNAGAYGGEFKDVVSSVTCLAKDGKIKTYEKGELDFSYRHSVFSDTGEIVLYTTFSLKKGEKESIKSQMDDYMFRRTSKQPLDFPSAGSVFKRPQGNFAGTLIEKCGLKGTRVGGAEVSQKHAGFIINADNATCKDVEELIKLVQKKVEEETGYFLEREIIFLK